MTKDTLQQALVNVHDAILRGNSDGELLVMIDDALRDAKAQQEQPAQEACWCDQNNIGEPGVSCGDCPTRDYKQPALSDAKAQQEQQEQQEQPAQGKCKCGHVGTSITVVESFPVHSVSVDEEDPDYKEHYYGLDVDATLQIGLEICRNCKTINGFWIEDTGGAEFYADWGKPRYTHPAPTQPALSESQITSIAYNCNALPEVITDKTLVDFVRAIEAHCRGGNHG